jgi:hypothetical protein
MMGGAHHKQKQVTFFVILLGEQKCVALRRYTLVTGWIALGGLPVNTFPPVRLRMRKSRMDTSRLIFERQDTKLLQFLLK